VIELGAGVLAATIFLWRAAHSDSPGGLPKWVRDRADRRSFGGYGGDSGYGDVRYGYDDDVSVVAAAVELVVDVVGDVGDD
jgi:hypothetical protein